MDGARTPVGEGTWYIGHVDDVEGLAAVVGTPLPDLDSCDVLNQIGIVIAPEHVNWATSRRPETRPDGQVDIRDGFFAFRF